MDKRQSLWQAVLGKPEEPHVSQWNQNTPLDFPGGPVVQNPSTSTIYNSWDIEVTQMSIDRGMDKEIVVCIYSGILLNHKKEWIWFSSSEVDEPRACYSEWSKSEREKQISYINTYIWNLERWY